MKKHLVSIRYAIKSGIYAGENFIFTGLVTAREAGNGKIVICPNKLFLNAFGFQLPNNSVIHY